LEVMSDGRWWLRQALQRWQGHADAVVAEQVAWSLGR
jgi:hypothetical protein